MDCWERGCLDDAPCNSWFENTFKRFRLMLAEEQNKVGDHVTAYWLVVL
jgi:hypothetical protein